MTIAAKTGNTSSAITLCASGTNAIANEPSVTLGSVGRLSTASRASNAIGVTASALASAKRADT